MPHPRSGSPPTVAIIQSIGYLGTPKSTRQLAVLVPRNHLATIGLSSWPASAPPLQHTTPHRTRTLRPTHTTRDGSLLDGFEIAQVVSVGYFRPNRIHQPLHLRKILRGSSTGIIDFGGRRILAEQPDPYFSHYRPGEYSRWDHSYPGRNRFATSNFRSASIPTESDQCQLGSLFVSLAC